MKIIIFHFIRAMAMKNRGEGSSTGLDNFSSFPITDNTA